MRDIENSRLYFYIIYNLMTNFFVDLFVHVLCACFGVCVAKSLQQQQQAAKQMEQNNTKWEGRKDVCIFLHLCSKDILFTTHYLKQKNTQSTHQQKAKHATNHFLWIGLCRKGKLQI